MMPVCLAPDKPGGRVPNTQNQPEPVNMPPISHYEPEKTSDASQCSVDGKCDLTPQTRWQIALFALIGIAIVSGFFSGMYYLLQIMGLVA